MKCIKCGCESFILETTVITTETYKIYKNGRVSDHPIDKDFCGGDMADNDNIIRCTNCNQGYVLPFRSRTDLLGKTNFKDIVLSEKYLTEY